MAQILTYDDGVRLFGAGVSFGVNIGIGIVSQKALTVSTSPVTESHDPFEDFLDKFNHDPSWATFPRWLDDYRRRTNHRFVQPDED